jgi:hypothetical protein
MAVLQQLLYLPLAEGMLGIIKAAVVVVHSIRLAANSQPALVVAGAAHIFPKHITHPNLPLAQQLF